MNIGIFETEHFEGAYPLIKLFDNGGNRVTIFTNSHCFRQFRYLLIGRLVRPQLNPMPVAAPSAPSPAAARIELSPEVAPVALEPAVAATMPAEAPTGVVPLTMPKRRSRRTPSNEDS